MNGLRWVLQILFRYPVKTTYVAVVSLLEVLLFLYPISITADVIQLVIEGGTLAAAKDKLWFLLGLALFQALIFFSVSFLNEVLAHRVSTDMTQEYFEALQFRSQTYHDSKDVGQIMARATGDTRTVNIAISPAIRIILEVCMVWIVLFIITARIHFVLTIISILVYAVFLWASFVYGKRIVPYVMDTRETFGDVSEITNTCFTGVREIKSSVAEMWAKRKFGQKAKRYQQSEYEAGRRSAWFYPIFVVTIFSAAILVMTLFFAYKSLFGISVKDIVLIAGIITILLNISEELGWSVEYLIRGKAASERLYAIITEADPGAQTEGTSDLQEFPATIEFKGVSFRYREDLPFALKNISFAVKEHQTVAIVGGPGSGKSSLTKLIQRLYAPTKGEILLGGQSIQTFSNTSLRKAIATVEQDIFLFNSSVRENIRFGKPEASDDEVVAVAKLAEAHEFIVEMPDQYNNLIGEGGVRLSGGQAQRISIARALLVNPKILLMDDGASALDSRTEIKIQNAISEILKSHTTIITTHRLSIIAKADLVIILERGEIVGLGTHESLIRSNRFYRRLFERHYDLPPVAGSNAPIEVE